MAFHVRAVLVCTWTNPRSTPASEILRTLLLGQAPSDIVKLAGTTHILRATGRGIAGCSSGPDHERTAHGSCGRPAQLCSRGLLRWIPVHPLQHARRTWRPAYLRRVFCFWCSPGLFVVQRSRLHSCRRNSCRIRGLRQCSHPRRWNSGQPKHLLCSSALRR